VAPQTHPYQVVPEIQAARWSLALRIAFRFCFVYFGLFCLVTQILGGLFPIPKTEVPDLATLPPVRQIVLWTASHVFGIKHPLAYADTGSGDRTFDWILVFCLLVCAAVATAVWSALDRRRANYDSLYKWFRLFIRFALASELILYGMDKAVPLQMPFPFLTRLVEPYGNFSPMGNLWAFVGASRPYEIFVGCAEMLGGLLLIVPRTTMLGALVALADLIQVFMLNMTYDVPVKLLSFHLLLMALFLLAPDLPRLCSFFFLNRPTDSSAQYQVFRSRRRNRIALAAQVLLGLWIVGVNGYNARSAWNTYGGARPKSPLYGIWNVTQISSDGRSAVPDYDRWRRLIFDFPTNMAVQQMDDSFTYYGATINPAAKTLALTGNAASRSKGNFTFQRLSANELALVGDMDGQRLHIQLQLLDREKLLLVSRGFHWIQERPLNR
jgi:uncharacterized membrane protein YphA (DoxX/SURF4 family)